MLEEYKNHVIDREKQGLPPLPLNAEQTASLIELLKQKSRDDKPELLEILSNRVPAGVDQAAFVKAAFLNDIASEKINLSIISPVHAIVLLGTMLGGYNVQALVELLKTKHADKAVKALSKITLIFDAFYDVEELHKSGNIFATQLIQSWADAEWFINKDKTPTIINAVVFRVEGEVNTDDLSPAQEAWSRADIPLHSQSMLQNKIPQALDIINKLKEKKLPLVFVGDVVGTGSSRKSAINSLQWHMGNSIDFIPNKNSGGIVLGNKIAPIFFNTAEDSGALPIECDVSQLKMGDQIGIDIQNNKILNGEEELCGFKLNPSTLLDELRAGGRIPLIIGRGLTEKARTSLNMKKTKVFITSIPQDKNDSNGYTLAQKIVGKACGVKGIRPGIYCEPRMTTVGSQDTTGAMTRDELKELACLGFSADLVMQSFCHTAAYPKPVDLELQHSLPDFINSRGGVSLKAGDGVIHSWLNRMILPDTVGTGGDSHTRFPLGISFPAGSGLVAFGAAIGIMPIDMPVSVRI
jgi:aconitate hydratase 2/2-methylisocitrate dehydratase